MFKTIVVRNKNLHECPLCGDKIEAGRTAFLENNHSFHPGCYQRVRQSINFSTELLGYFNPV